MIGFCKQKHNNDRFLLNKENNTTDDRKCRSKYILSLFNNIRVFVELDCKLVVGMSSRLSHRMRFSNLS